MDNIQIDKSYTKPIVQIILYDFKVVDQSFIIDRIPILHLYAR